MFENTFMSLLCNPIEINILDKDYKNTSIKYNISQYM